MSFVYDKLIFTTISGFPLAAMLSSFSRERCRTFFNEIFNCLNVKNLILLHFNFVQKSVTFRQWEIAVAVGEEK